jgi:hypothetical protein
VPAPTERSEVPYEHDFVCGSGPDSRLGVVRLELATARLPVHRRQRADEHVAVAVRLRRQPLGSSPDRHVGAFPNGVESLSGPAGAPIMGLLRVRGRWALPLGFGR